MVVQVGSAATEYDTVYRPFLAERLAQRQRKQEEDEQKRVRQAVDQAKRTQGMTC